MWYMSLSWVELNAINVFLYSVQVYLSMFHCLPFFYNHQAVLFTGGSKVFHYSPKERLGKSMAYPTTNVIENTFNSSSPFNAGEGKQGNSSCTFIAYPIGITWPFLLAWHASLLLKPNAKTFSQYCAAISLCTTFMSLKESKNNTYFLAATYFDLLSSCYCITDVILLLSHIVSYQLENILNLDLAFGTGGQMTWWTCN